MITSRTVSETLPLLHSLPDVRWPRVHD